jgi:DNA polymerase-1
MLVTDSNFAPIMEKLDQQRRLISDVETTGLRRWHGDRICGYALGTPSLGEEVYYFPVRHAEGWNLSKHQHNHVKKLLSKPGVVYTGFNYKFDIEMMIQEGIPIPELIEDVMLAAHLMNENERTFQLKGLADIYIDPEASLEEQKLKELLAEHGFDKGDMWRLDAKMVEPYACDDVRLTELLRGLYLHGLRNWRLADLWYEVSQYELATVRMEWQGLLLDQELTRQYIKEAELQTRKAYNKLKSLAGYEINPRSYPQMSAFLGMKSTAKEFLEELGEGIPEVDAVLDYRAWSKANDTYYLPYLEKYVDEWGIIHANLNLHGTISGRLSASDPNLQAIPRYTNIYKIKDVFIAKPGHLLLSADYSQAELRLGAHYANEKLMARILNGGGDIHGATAAELELDRDAAKRINFGVFYGIGARKLARTLRIPLALAEEYLDKYHAKFKNIRSTYRFMQNKALLEGYIRLWTGRVRRYNTEHSEPHKALSNLIQGGVGEIMRHSITRLDQMVKEGWFAMTLQVHDQILFDIPIENRKEVLPEIRSVMEDFPQFHLVPPKVDFSISGDRWGNVVPEFTKSGDQNPAWNEIMERADVSSREHSSRGRRAVRK